MTYAGQRGFALIAVLVVLSLLLALTGPFLLSMGHGDTVAQDLVDQRQVELLSSSVRDIVLQGVAQTHESVDETRTEDDRSEFPAQLDLPAGFADLRREGFNDHLLSAETEDLQRRINLDTATPLLIANLLHTVTRLSDDHDPEVRVLTVDDTTHFPEQGYLLVDHELIRYGAKQSNAFVDLERGLLSGEKGYEPHEKHTLARGELVLDFRCVLAVMHSFYHGTDAARAERRQLASVDDVGRIGELGFGVFTPAELDVLREYCTVASVREDATDWGPAERVFDITDRYLTVRNGEGFGAGGVVRIRSADCKCIQYGLCWALREARLGTVDLPEPRWVIDLLLPPVLPLEPFTTFVEPLLPHPVNVNTADETVLAALMENLRYGPRMRPHADPSRPPFTSGEAAQIAHDLCALRGDGGTAAPEDGSEAEVRPFDGDEDLARRYFKSHLTQSDARQRARWLLLYRSLRSGNVGDLEMATAPICYTSAPVVSYRAAAMRTRGANVAARLERSGTAVVMPGTSLDLVLSTQADFENRFRIDQRAPFYTTHPINLGSTTLGAAGSFVPPELAANPPPRDFAHVLPMAFPEAGLGSARFPSRDGHGDGFKPATSHTPFAYRDNGLEAAEESMWSSANPEGRDVAQEGAYDLVNSGPRASPSQGNGGSSGGGAHHPTFAFTEAGGLVARHAITFWFMPRDTGNQMLFDLAADDPVRNRISLQLRDGFLELEVLDAAGLDSDAAAIDAAGTSPKRTAGTWRVSLVDLDLRPDIWYHASLGVDGNQPSQLRLLIDGVPRGEPLLRTYLTARVPEYTPQQTAPNATPGPFWSDKAKYLEIRVEDTESFPPQGVLRIGLELFEYTTKTASSFQCTFARGQRVLNSMGGRVGRMDIREMLPNIPVDGQGRPTQLMSDLKFNSSTLVAPPHEIGAAVELYGYAQALYPDTVTQVGTGRLTTSVGAFAVARMINNKSPFIVWQSLGDRRQGNPITIGWGIKDSDSVDIELGDPIAGKDPKPASEEINSAFATGGGYALLVQRYFSKLSGSSMKPGAPEPVDLGGIELIRYSARTGNKLTGVQRGQTVPPAHTSSLFDGRAHNFIGVWGDADYKGTANESITGFLTFVVPVTLAVQGSFADPTALGRSEWVQLYPQGGDESGSEWVRYDYITSNWLMRANVSAWESLYTALTNAQPLDNAVGSDGHTSANAAIATYANVNADGSGYIGYPDPIEVSYPLIQSARYGLGFRGDPLTRTTSHAQSTNTAVMPVHRLQLAWGNYGALDGRAGRNDRVALVGGATTDGAAPPAEWHTINWVARRYDGDHAEGGKPPAQGQELLGAYPMQLVAFKESVRQLFVGAQLGNLRDDVRLVDRLVKFPSGELSAVAPEKGVLGAAPQKDLPDFHGVVDELVAVPHPSVALVVDEPFGDSAAELIVRQDLLVTPRGELTVNEDLSAKMPTTGGLIAIDGEILAYRSHDGGRFQIAGNGRGLLGTEPRAHDEGAMVYFLEQVPAAILAAGVSENSPEIVVNDMGNLPRHGGTLLLGRSELLHYCWSSGRRLLEMPTWIDPTDHDTKGRGLFRGRYGTTPVSASAGEPVILFPFRYWDRAHERADDPELAEFQITTSLAPVFYTGISWQDDKPDPLVSVRCTVRIDGRASFAGDPATEPGLYVFTDGNPGNAPNPLRRQGSRLEARFTTVYKPGAFDPQAFRAQAWKRAPMVRAVLLDYEGESRILEERITAR